MPLYYIIFKKDGEVIESDEPLDRPNVQAAWKEATITAGQIIEDYDGSLAPNSEWIVQIQDKDRKPLRTIRIIAESSKT